MGAYADIAIQATLGEDTGLGLLSRIEHSPDDWRIRAVLVATLAALLHGEEGSARLASVKTVLEAFASVRCEPLAHATAREEA